MGQGYTRQEAANILTGEIVQASHLNNELNQLVSAFDASTGHTHDGTVAEGGPITILGPNQEINVSSTAIYPTTNNVYNFGTPNNVFNSVYVSNLYVGTGTGTIALNDLDDVTIGSPEALANNHILQYNSTSSQWENTGSPTFPGNVTIEGNLTVNGTSTFNDDVAINGDLTVQNFSATGTTTVTNLVINGTAAGLSKKYDVKTVAGTAYTLLLADNYKYIRYTSGSAVTITVPTNASAAFPVGSNVHFNQAGSGSVTFSPASTAVTVNGRAGDDGIAAQYVTVSLVKVATDEWDLIGALG